MGDILFLAISFIFLRSHSRTCTCATGCGERVTVSIESIVMLSISIVLTVYLVWALLRPEDF